MKVQRSIPIDCFFIAFLYQKFLTSCRKKNAQRSTLIAARVFARVYHAPNLSNIFPFACIRRMRYFASNTPSEPMFAPVSVKRSSLSEPE